MWVDVCYRDVC